MESAMAFLAWCVVIVVISASRTGGIVIPQPRVNADTADLLTRLSDGVFKLPGAPDNSSSDSDAVPPARGAGQSDAWRRGNRRSAPAGAGPGDSPAAFALAEGISGAELAVILRGLPGSAPVSLRCSRGQPVAAGSHQASYAEYASDTCSLVPAVDNAKVNTRGLCPWTYVEHTDPDRYPNTMLYAQCACPDCVRQSVSLDYGCHPVYNDAKVLRKRACQDGIQIYESVFERVPVACACLRSLE